MLLNKEKVTPLGVTLFCKEIGRFEEKAMFATEDVYTYSESSANIGRKSPLFLKKSAGFQPNIVSFTSFLFDLRLLYLFLDFFGFTKYDSPFLI